MSTIEGSDPRHFVCDFAEKVFLSTLILQPGKLHFVTGLKFAISATSTSRSGLNYYFGLPEGHWQNGKTENSVISMLHYVLCETMEPGPRRIYLHADN